MVINIHSRSITFAVSVGHSDDILLIPAHEQQPGFAIQNSGQRVTYNSRTEKYWIKEHMYQFSL